MTPATKETAFVIRPMRRSELDILVEWAADEGWNPGLHDAPVFFATDPDGFWVGLLDGVPVAAISAVRYGDDYAFLGFYIVSPAHRGQGYGYQVWQAAIKALGQRTIGLDGVPEQQENYRRAGFQLAHRNIRYLGEGLPNLQHGVMRADADLVALHAVPFAQIAAYDRDFFPVARDIFLRHWIQQPGTTALGIRTHHGLSAYGVIRPCRSGWKIGPLFADTAQDAQALFRSLAATVTGGAPFYLDVPQCNPAAIALAEQHGMWPVFETARMYTRAQPELSWSRTYGITTFELG